MTEKIIITKEMIQQEIDWIDEFINTDSFLITDQKYDQALWKWNLVFDKFNNWSENNETKQMSLENKRAREWLEMKAEVTTTDWKSKQKYTDKTLEMALDLKYEKEIQEQTVNKFFMKVLPNKLKVLEHKLNFIKLVRKTWA